MLKVQAIHGELYGLKWP